MITCSKCNILKDDSEFQYKVCRSCKKEYMKNWRKNNRPKLREDFREYMKTPGARERKNESCRKYGARNKDKRNEKAKLNRKLNPKIQAIARVRTALRHLATTRGSTRYLPYTKVELLRHLEANFKPGMTWENITEWQIDHIIPLRYKHPDGSYFWNQEELADHNSDTFKKAWGLNNLQPLWALDNNVKNNRRIGA